MMSSTPVAKRLKLDSLPQCPYGDKCYRKNPEHLKEYSHMSSSTNNATVPKSTTNEKTNALPVCPFGATCYRKNLLHFAEYSHPFNLLNPDEDDENDEIQKDNVKTNSEIKKVEEEFDSQKTEEYDSDDENMYDIKLEKSYSQMNDDEKRLMIERAFELKDKLQEKLKKTREEAEEKKKEIEQLQNKMGEGILLMEGEDDILKGSDVKYFELFPERNYKQGSAADVHFRLAESQFYRLLSGYATARVTKVEYVCNPTLIHKFNKAREEVKKKRGENYSYPILAFHGTAIKNIQPICENGFKVPGQEGFAHATDTGYYGRGTYFSEYPGYSMGYIKGATKLLLCQILQGKVYQCTQLILGADLQDGYDSHCSPNKKELIIFRSDFILPQYIVHYKLDGGEFQYAATAQTKEDIKKKFLKIGKLYKKAVETKDKKIFVGYKFAFIGKMADTPIAIEALIKRFGGHVCKNKVPFGGLTITTGLLVNGYPATIPYDAPNVIICSFDEYQAETSSELLQAYKNLGFLTFYREDFIYDSIVEGTLKTLSDYLHN